MTLRGAAHIHSRYSYDGTLTLAQLRELLVARGLQFALMTEHTDAISADAAREFIAACRQASDETFCFVPGFEVPYLENHTLVMGAHTYHEGREPRDLLERWHAEGALLVAAHPHRNGYRIDDFLRSHVDGIEIWNSQYDGIHAPRTHASRLYASVSSHRPVVKAYASLDLHRAANRHGPHLVVEGDVLTEEGIITALRKGSFYAQRGSVAITSDGKIRSGNAMLIKIAGVVMPAFIAFLKGCSSVAWHLGLRSSPIKKWIRAHV